MRLSHTAGFRMDDDQWTLVVRKKSFHRRRAFVPKEGFKYIEKNAGKYAKCSITTKCVIERIESLICRIQTSSFVTDLLCELKQRLFKGFDLVGYGLGSISSSDRSCYQFACFLLIKRRMKCIETQIYDPIFSEVP